MIEIVMLKEEVGESKQSHSLVVAQDDVGSTSVSGGN
jgi:hypothetical protein